MEMYTESLKAELNAKHISPLPVAGPSRHQHQHPPILTGALAHPHLYSPICTMSSQPLVARQLAGKTVVVVGGSSGIGFAVASSLVEEGATAIIASSSVGKA
jgi:3-oxoacyl-ACP reductase-like protein